MTRSVNYHRARRQIALYDNHDLALAGLREAVNEPSADEAVDKAWRRYCMSLARLRNGQLEAVPVLLPDGKLMKGGNALTGDPDGPLSSPSAAARLDETQGAE